MFRIIKKLGVLLDRKQKQTMFGLMILMIIGGALQLAGVGVLVQVADVVIDDLYSLPVSVPSFFQQAIPALTVQPPRSQTPPLPNSPSWST